MTTAIAADDPAPKRAARGEPYRIAEIDEIAFAMPKAWRDDFIAMGKQDILQTRVAETRVTEAKALLRATTLYEALSSEGKERALRVVTAQNQR